MVRALPLVLALLLAFPAAGALSLEAPEEPRRLMRVLDPLAQPQHTPTPAGATGIGPGSNLYMDFGEGFLYACTANFLWRATNGKTYLGAAGHCFLDPEAGATATHGPGADYDPRDTRVIVCVSACTFGGQLGFLSDGTTVELGPVAYARQTGASGDIGNDFGLVEIPASLLPQTRASLPVFGGPTSAAAQDADTLLCHYGNGVGVGEVFPTKGRVGVGLGTFDDGSWQAAIASEVGDSGSAVVSCDTHAGGLHGIRPVGLITHGIGVVATVPGIAFGTSIPRAQELAREAGLTISVVTGP